MKILHIIIGLGNGGAENTLFKISSTKKNAYLHEVISLTRNKSLLSKFKKNNIKVYFLNFAKYSLNIFQIIKLILLIKKINPQLICSWMYHAIFISILIKNFFKKKNIWLIRHGNFNKKYTKKTTLFLKNIIKKFSSCADHIIYCSHSSKKIHTEYGFSNLNAKVIVNGVDINKFKFNKKFKIKLREELKIPKNYFVIGMVGRYHPQKNHEQLFRVLKKEKIKEINIAIVLIGKDIKKIKSQIINQNKKHKFYFINERHDIHKFYSLFDLHLSTSSFGESFPNVLIESMACKIPTIASNLSDNKKILNNKKMIFSINDDEDLASKIISIVNLYNKKRIRYLTSTLSDRVVQFYSLEKMLNNYELVFKKTIMKK